MIFKAFGNKEFPTIVLLHGGGLSWWSLEKVINEFQKEFHIIAPVIDGHGEDSETPFISIEEVGRKLVEYIDSEHFGKVFCIYGLSIGAQILCEVLSNREDITEFAIIESALVEPIVGVKLIAKSTKIFYPLLSKRWFAKIQSKTLFVPDNMFEHYYRDSMRMTVETLVNITLSNGRYRLKDGIKNTHTHALIIVGEKELRKMKKSAIIIARNIKGSSIYESKGMKHGELSLAENDKFIKIIREFISDDKRVNN